MSNITVTNLPVLTSLSGSSQTMVVQNGVSYSATAQQIANLNANGGTVTSVTAQSPLSGGTITSTGTIGLNNNGVTNTYLAQMGGNTLKGNNTSGSAQPVDLTVSQTMTMLGAAPLASPALTGIPTAPTALSSDNSTQIATTAFVKSQSYGSGSVTSITAGTGLSGGTITSSGTIAIANTGVTAQTYGTASTVPQIAVNAQGQITSASNLSINIAASQITSGVLGSTYGGTGLSTFTAANNAIYSTSSSALTAGTLPVLAGGTGQTTASAAFNALSPITSTGDLIIGNGVNSATRLAIGTNGYVLTSNGTTATWAASGSGSGTVNSGTAGQLTYYASTGTAVSGNANATISAGALTLGVAGTAAGNLLLSGSTSGTVTLKTAAAAGTWSMTLPTTAGTNGYVLQTDGTGVTSWVATSSGGGTVTSVSQTFTGGLISVSGSPITGSGTLALTVAGTSGGVVYFSSASQWASSAALTANALMIGGGAGAAPATTTTGTGVLTALGNTTNAASGIVVKDANANITTNALYQGFTNAAATTTITLTASSTPNRVVTGSGGQTFTLPDATTLPVGATFTFNNNQSSGAITVNNNSSTLIVSIPSGGFATVILLTNSVAAGTWDYHFNAPANVSWSTNTFSYPGSITSATWNGNVIGPAYGGTGIANNAASTLTISGNFATTLTVSGTTTLTLPTSGTVTALGNTTTGSGNIVLATSPSLTTPTLGVASATSINKVTITAPATGSTLTIADGKTLTVNNTLTLSGTDSTTMTFPSTSATLGGLGVSQTWTSQNKFNNIIDVNNAVTVTSNAGTVPVTYRLNTFTNSSAATMTITMATASAVDGQMTIVRIYDFSAATQTISWVNTENSTVSVPTTSNGSTTLPKTVGFMYNGQTSLWRCIASA